MLCWLFSCEKLNPANYLHSQNVLKDAITVTKAFNAIYVRNRKDKERVEKNCDFPSHLERKLTIRLSILRQIKF
jgi:hypothetical protein